MPNAPLLKILWIEDQPNENASFPRDCAVEGFKLVNVLTAEEGIKQLKKNPQLYAGVILDAMGYKNSSDEGLNKAGLHYALKEIHAIMPDLPKVIFTGQKNLFNNEDFEEAVAIPVFHKTQDNDPLFDELRKQIEIRPDAELRRRYPDICNLCDGDFLPATKWSETLYPAIKEAHEGSLNPDRFNGLRKVLEAALKSLASNGILPECFDEAGQINLKYCELLLNGRSVTPHRQDTIHYYPSAALLDDTDQARIQLLKILTSEESHENQHHRTVADLSCAVFTLISLLPSLKELSQKEPTWKLIDFNQHEYEIPGKIAPNGRNFFSALGKKVRLEIPPQMMAANSLQPHDQIWVVCRNYQNRTHEVIDTRPLS